MFNKHHSYIVFEFYLLGYNIVSSIGIQPAFGRNMSPHLHRRIIRQKRNKSEAGSKLNFTLVSCFVYSSALKMGATCCSERSFDFQRIARRYSSFVKFAALNGLRYIVLIVNQTFLIYMECHGKYILRRPGYQTFLVI
jgi:hypothetical protein